MKKLMKNRKDSNHSVCVCLGEECIIDKTQMSDQRDSRNVTLRVCGVGQTDRQTDRQCVCVCVCVCVLAVKHLSTRLSSGELASACRRRVCVTESRWSRQD